MQKILHFDSLNPKYFAFVTASIKIFWIEPSQMQNIVHCTSRDAKFISLCFQALMGLGAG
jgi:hypothetical protein